MHQPPRPNPIKSKTPYHPPTHHPTPPGPTARAGHAFLEASLRHKSEAVIYEAARAMCCALPGLEARDLGG